MKFRIIGKTFENPVIEAENADEAVIQFATNMDTNMNLYFEAIPVKECEPLMRITDIEWDVDPEDFDNEAEYEAVLENVLPKSVDLNEFIEDDREIADYLSDEYGYCVKCFKVEDETNPDLMADIYVAYYENGERKEFEYFDINNFFEDLNTDRLSFPKPSAELHEVKMNGKELYPADFAQLLLILGYEDNMKDDNSSIAITKEPYDISSQTALSVLAASMPKDFSMFNSETGFGEPEHYMDLPNGRILKIVYQETGDDKRYYSWQVLYSDDELTEIDYIPDDLVIAEEDSDDFEFDTVYSELDWAIRIATETPKYKADKPKFSVGNEVRYKGDHCYVIDVKENGLNLFNTNTRNAFSLINNQIADLALEGHSEMAEKVFS